MTDNPDGRRRLLFVSPTWPRPTGNGLAMRAAHVIRAYSTRFRVQVAVLSDMNGPEVGEAPPEGCEACEALPVRADTYFSLVRRIRDDRERFAAFATYPRPVDSRLVSPEATDRVTELAAQVDVVHLMRLYLAPLIETVAQRKTRPMLILDCDDDDAAYHRSRATRVDPVLNLEERQFELAEADKYEAMKTQWLPLFDRVLVASPADIGQMSQAATVTCLPNVVEAPRAAPTIDRDPHTLRVLFVGNLGYPPNADAVQWLSNDLAPVLAKRWPGRLTIEVVGGGLENSGDLHPTLNLRGYVADLGPSYARCDVAVAPLRFGSGTPIKVIEAMAAGVPVVATAFAAFRLGARDGVDVLIADDAADFADACIRFKQDSTLRAAATGKARSLAEQRYSPAALERLLATIV